MDINQRGLETNPLKGATDEDFKGLEANLDKLAGPPIIKQGSPINLSKEITPELQSIVDDAVEHMGQDEVVDKVDSGTVEDIERRFEDNAGTSLDTNKINNNTERQDGLSI